MMNQEKMSISFRFFIYLYLTLGIMMFIFGIRENLLLFALGGIGICIITVKAYYFRKKRVI